MNPEVLSGRTKKGNQRSKIDEISDIIGIKKAAQYIGDKASNFEFNGRYFKWDYIFG